MPAQSAAGEMNSKDKMRNGRKINSQPNNSATPIENVRGSTIARIPQAKTTTAEAVNQ